MTYARSRLYLGMLNVAFWVGLSILGLWFGFSELVDQFAGLHQHTLVLGAGLLLYILLSLPFDMIGGYFLPQKYGQNPQKFSSWLGKWSRGVLMQASFLLLAGYLLLISGIAFGAPGAIITFSLLMFGQILAQLPIAQLVAPLKLEAEEVSTDLDLQHNNCRFYSADSEDTAFTGGITGLPGNEVVIMPSHWREKGQQELFNILITRRIGVILSGSRIRGLVIACLWNLAAFSLAVLLSPMGLHSVGGLVDTIFIFSLLSFVGLFGLLPELNRRAVFENDLWTHQKGVDEIKLQRSFSYTESLQNNQPCRNRAVEFLCHPIPSVENRILNLFTLKPKRGAWQSARMMLYLSWSGMGLISRAAICNIGRPDLWVLMPCD